MEQVDNLSHKFTKVEAEEKIEVTMTDTIMINEATRKDINQIAETEDSTDRTEVAIEVGVQAIVGPGQDQEPI